MWSPKHVIVICHNLSLGLATKARACKGVSREWSSGVTFHAPKNVGGVKEWTHTLPSGLWLWELESQWTLEFSKSNCRGQNSLDWRVHYIIENLLECRCFKWACTSHLITWKTNYGGKKGQESKCQFDSWPLKVKNILNLLACKCHVTSLESSQWRLQLCFRIHLNGKSTLTLWAFKVAGVSI
jgi:hypothetical protein